MYDLYNSYLSDNLKKYTIWNVGIYTRLSREDEKDNMFNKQSESIENQIKFLTKFVKSKQWNIINVYVDDGYSGTNFERPNFKKMISDIEKKIINLVITKDLSRLGRDYIETGYYIEKYFPLKNIRFIAVTDNIDTFDNSNANNDMTPFKSVVNDMYAKDTSKKVRTTLLTKAMNGESIKSFQPYGYKKDENNKNKIVVDRLVAGNVYNIFEMYKSGKTKKEICEYLNENNILTPLKYKEQTSNYFNPNKKYYLWTNTMITKILRDRIYIGDLVQHKTEKVNYKIKKVIKLPPAQHIIVKNNHEAIVTEKIFSSVQIMLNKQTNEWKNTNGKDHLLKGLVFCSCGARITYSKNHGKDFRCICSSYKKNGAKFCNNIQYLKEKELINMVSQDLKSKIDKYFNFKKLNYEVEETKKRKDDLDNIERQIDIINKKIKKLYEDKLNGIISTELFVQLSTDYENQKSQYHLIMTNTQKNIYEKNKKVSSQDIERYVAEILKFNDENKIDRSIYIKLIDKIIIENKKISSITYNFSIPKI